MSSYKPEIKKVCNKNVLGFVNSASIFPAAPLPPWYKRCWKAAVPVLVAIIAAICWMISHYTDIKAIKNDIAPAAETQKSQ